MSTKIKSIRFPADLAEAAEKSAKDQGLSFNQLVVSLVKQHVTGTASDEAKLLEAIASWLNRNYSSSSFPIDVTLRTFHQVRDDQTLRRNYDSIVLDVNGCKDFPALMSLHRRIGLQVKEILGGEVMGRSLPLDPSEHLIKSYALLKPKGS